eukprot:1205701-Prymnesium_polylepis.1
MACYAIGPMLRFMVHCNKVLGSRHSSCTAMRMPPATASAQPAPRRRPSNRTTTRRLVSRHYPVNR